MNSVIVGTIIGANRYNVEGTKGGNIWLMQPVREGDENAVGYEAMKIACPYDLVERIGRDKLPAEYEIEVELSRGAQQTTKLRAKAVRPVKGTLQTGTGATAGKAA